MRQKQTFEGKWWLRGREAPPLFGILTFDPGRGLKLIAKNPTSLTLPEVVSGFAAAQSSVIPPVLHGQDQHGKTISLFGCAADRHGVSSGLETFEISAIAGLVGDEFPDWSSAKFLTAHVHFTLLHEWLNEPGIEHIKTVDGRPAVALKPSHDAWVYQLGDGERLRFDRDIATHESVSEYKLDFGHSAWFHFSSEKSLSTTIDERITPVRQLLSLLIGERVYADRVDLYHIDPYMPAGVVPEQIQLLQPNPGLRTAPREMHAHRMIAPFSEVELTFQRTVTRWFAIHRRLEPVIDLYFAVLFNRRIPVTTQFLQLAQALEAYHSRSGHFPFVQQKTLAERLDDVFRLHSNEAAELFSSISDLAARIRYTRNYLTHYDEKMRAKIFSEGELSQVTFWLLPFLQICLLKELEITGAPVRRILHRYKDVRFIDLASASHGSSTSAERGEAALND
jgi:hypothetical protein